MVIHSPFFNGKYNKRVLRGFFFLEWRCHQDKLTFISITVKRLTNIAIEVVRFLKSFLYVLLHTKWHTCRPLFLFIHVQMALGQSSKTGQNKYFHWLLLMTALTVMLFVFFLPILLYSLIDIIFFSCLFQN